MTILFDFITRHFAELRRRKVLRVGITYAIVAWLLLQIAEVTFEPLQLPEWALTLVVVLAILGFPVALALAWAFEVTPEGIKLDADARSDEQDRREQESTAAADSAGPTVAVLAFDDMSPEQDQGYFCEGIAEEILNRLAQVENLGVASRTSSFRFKGQRADIGTIGKNLGVSTILEGSVRKAGQRLRITTQLISVADGYHLWSERYDRDLEDIFEIQDQIAAHVADALQVRLGTSVCEERTTCDVEAYEFYLRGLHYFHRWGLKNVRFAIEMFSKAVEIDPGYARGWAALADCYAMVCLYWSASQENLDGTTRASEKALELAPDLAESHACRGLAHTAHREHEQAEAEFETAIRLDPNLFAAYYFFARVCFHQGKLERAAELFEQAERVRPEDFQSPILLRQVYHSLGRDDEAHEASRRGLEKAEKHLELNPDDTRALNLGFGALVNLGEKERAMGWADRSLAIDGDNPDTLYNIACGFALAGEPERALDCLERAHLHGMMIAEWAENDSDLESLHDHPRFRAILGDTRQPVAGN